MAISLSKIEPKTSKKTGGRNQKTGSPLERILSYEIGGTKIKDSFRESFYGELAMLLEAGMNLKSVLDLLTAQQKKESQRTLLKNITEQLTRGGRFSEVLKAQSKFTPYEYYSISIGEETGNLIEVLRRLSAYYNSRIQQKRALIGALTYPVVILFTAIMAVLFMLAYMVPMFEDVFARMGGTLPWLTQVLINVSDASGKIIFITGALLAALMTLHFFYRNNSKYQEIRSKVIMKIPVIGQIIIKTHTLRLVETLSLLITSRVPLTQALELSKRMVQFYAIRDSLEQVRLKILQGSGLHEGLAAFPFYEKRFISLIKVGEETNQMGTILNRLSQQMEEELRHRAKILGNIMEPLIIVFLGGVVALILIAMYLPMFQLSSGF